MTRRTFAGACAAAVARAGIPKTRDPRTGREVWQITSGPSISHSCYFESQPFTRDDRFLVFCSNRSGSFQLHAVELETGNIRQITRCRRLSTMSFSVHPDGASVYYLDGSALCRTEVASGKSDTVADLTAAFPGASPNATFSGGRVFSSDARYTPVSFSGESGAAMGLADIRTGKVEKVLRLQSGSGGHMLLCPSDSDIVTFVKKPDEQNDMTLPMERRARTMIANLRTGEIRPYLTMPYGSRATHEYWAPDGKRFFFHRKTVPGWSPASIWSMKKDGTDWVRHYQSDTLKLGHSMISRDGRFIVSDVQNPKENPLLRIHLAGGKSDVLCWPNSSAGEPQLTHVHPAISASMKFVAFTSDRGGVPQVYVVPLPAV